MMDSHTTITHADLGINDAGEHSATLTTIEERCIDILQRQGQGRESAIPANTLAGWVFGGCDLEQAKRNVRELTNHLINTHLLPICSMPGNGGGYWLPGSPEEEAAVYEARRKRVMTGLMKMSRGRKAAYVDIIDQLTLCFDEPEGAQAIERMNLAPENDPMPAFVRLITRGLARIESDPQKYAAEIKALQRNFSGIFVPKTTVRQIEEKIREAEHLLRGIAG